MVLLPLLWPSWSTQQVDADRRPKTGRTADGGLRRTAGPEAEGKKKGGREFGENGGKRSAKIQNCMCFATRQMGSSKSRSILIPKYKSYDWYSPTVISCVCHSPLLCSCSALPRQSEHNEGAINHSHAANTMNHGDGVGGSSSSR